MQRIFPLLIGGVGLLSGVLVNFIIFWFYERRQILDPEIITEVRDEGWVRYFSRPWTYQSLGLGHIIRVWVVQILFIFIALWLGFSPPERVQFVWGFPLLIYFAVVFVMDLEYKVILHPISYTGALIGIIIGWLLHGLLDTILGGIAGFGMMFGMYAFGNFLMPLIAKWRGNDLDEEALGFGDVNLSGIIGLLLGWPGIIAGLILGILAGGFVSLLLLGIMVLRRKVHAFVAIPYGPFLIFGAVFLLFFGNLLR